MTVARIDIGLLIGGEVRYGSMVVEPFRGTA
jgi:hypothetical protein